MTDLQPEQPPASPVVQQVVYASPPKKTWPSAVALFLVMFAAGGLLGYFVVGDLLNDGDGGHATAAPTTAPAVTATPAPTTAPPSTTPATTQLFVHDLGELRAMVPIGWVTESDTAEGGVASMRARAPEGNAEDRLSSPRLYVWRPPGQAAPADLGALLNSDSPVEGCAAPVREPYSVAGFSGLRDRYAACNGTAVEVWRIAVMWSDGLPIRVTATISGDRIEPAIAEVLQSLELSPAPALPPVVSAECSSDADAGSSTAPTVVNNSAAPVQVVWHGFDCVPEIYARIAPGKSWPVPSTRNGDRWSVATYDGTVLQTFSIPVPGDTVTVT